jgi:hypothetical protein
MRLALAGAAACAGVALAGCATAPAGPPEGPAPARAADAAPSTGSAGAARLGNACVQGDGPTIRFPADWSVNAGDRLPGCSWFDPEPFTVPASTDVRVAITIGIDPQLDPAEPFPDAVAVRPVQVDGRDGTRAERIAGPGLYPAGTPITTYTVALGNGTTLVATTVGLEPAEYAGHVRVLDQMMEEIDLDEAGRS